MGKRTQKSSRKIQTEAMTQENGVVQFQIDYQGIYSHQKKLELLCQKAEHDKNIELFSKVKYKQNIYQIGQYVHLYEPTETQPLVVKIHSIIRIPNQQVAAILKVQWLLRKTDLPAKFENYLQHFSSAQVFPSGQFDYVLIESIMRKCYVIQNSQYEYLQNAGDNIHFSRAVYDNKTESLNPDPSEWAKQCYCQNPVNPDLPYIQCQCCEHWFHNDCIKDPKLIQSESFACKNCEKKKKK